MSGHQIPRELKNTQLIFLWLGMGIALACSSCDAPAIYAGMAEIPQEGWAQEINQEFTVTISDSLPPTDVYVQLRNTERYPFSNIFLFLETEFPNGGLREDTLSVMLARPDGRWIGSGAGSTYDNDILVMREVQWPESGKYVFRIRHAMRSDVLPGIERVGLVLRRHGEQ